MENLHELTDQGHIEKWNKAKKLSQEYNQLDFTNENKKNEILDKLLGSYGKNLWLNTPFFVDYGVNIFLGDNVEINTGCVFLDCEKIVIGNNVLIGPGVHIYAVTHPVSVKERHNITDKNTSFYTSLAAPVKIGNNVWIGGGSIILPGVNIGNNVTIGAGSVVTKDIPDNKVAYGNPCKVIRNNE